MNGPNNKIGWCDFTANPIRGKCLHNCPHCYAEAIRRRYKWPEKIEYHYWLDCSQIRSFTKRTGKIPKIFVGSMHDIFGKWIPSDWIKDIIWQCWDCSFEHGRKLDPDLSKNLAIFQFLTQNPARYSEFDWPDNCWLGTTVRTQKEHYKRWFALRDIKTKVKFLSIEPILEQIFIIKPNLGKYPYGKYVRFYDSDSGLESWPNWVVIGCATDSRAKDCKLEWIENVVSQCDAAGAPVFVKQIPIGGKAVKDITKFPKHLQRREWPK